MKTKVMASVLAGVMSVQSVAMATSRVDAVGAEQIGAAKVGVSSINASLGELDAALGEASYNIEARDEDGLGRVMNVIDASSAVAGVAVGAFAAFLATGKGGAGPAMILMGTVGSALSAASAFSGGWRDSMQGKVESENAEALLKTSIRDISDILASTSVSEEVKMAALTLRASLFNLKNSLSAFKKDDSNDTKLRFIRELAQAAGFAMATAGMINGSTRRSENLLVLGSVVMSASNIVGAISMMSENQAKLIIKEIQNTRAMLNIARTQLK